MATLRIQLAIADPVVMSTGTRRGALVHHHHDQPSSPNIQA